MARAKKEAALTPEERLQAALVPDWEWPYKLPENWCWTTIKNAATVVTGGTPAKNNSDYYGGEFPFFKPADLDAGRHVSEASEYLSDLGKSVSRIIPAQATAVCCIGSIGKCGFLDVEGATNQQINSAIPYFNALYQYFYMNTEFFTNQLRNSASATTIAIVNKTKMESCYYPLAPLAEQQRIVDRIESLFAKLNEAKEKAQAVVDSFETRKAAILHKAFTGELTAKWREDHDVGMESWEKRLLSTVSSLQTGLMKGKKYTGKTVELPYLRVANVQDGFLCLDEIKKIDVEEKAISRYSLAVGDVLFTEGGDFDKLGRGTVWEGQIKNCLHQNHIFVVRPNPEVLNPYFLSYQAGSRYGKAYFLSCSKQTTNLASINSTQLKNFPVLIPSIAEQEMIIKLINSFLEKELHAKEVAEAVLGQIGLMKKSILARAFRGELGTNDPSEESAVELLKKVFQKE